MSETILKIHIVFVVLCIVFKGLHGIDQGLLFAVTKAPRYFGILQDHRGQPESVEISEEYMDQDYIAANKKRHRMFSDKNQVDADDFDDDDSEDDDKDKDRKSNKQKLRAGLV